MANEFTPIDVRTVLVLLRTCQVDDTTTLVRTQSFCRWTLQNQIIIKS